MKDLLKKQKGFTIIEVLIVLAIAGLIILIVFLAVPALQRNSRNTQRNGDASTIASAVSECLTNKNAQQTSCASTGDNAVPIDRTKIRQLVNEGDTDNITYCGQGAAGCGAFVPLTGGAAWTNATEVRYGDKCVATGDNVEAGTQRQFALVYQVENQRGNGVTKCIDS